MSRYIGNYLRVPSLEPQQSNAPGIWSLSEQLNYQRANVWPPARDPYYNQTVLHLSGDVAGTRETNPVTQPRTFLSDASPNNFLLTPNGDVSARPFSPYGTSWSTYFVPTANASTAGSNFSIASPTPGLSFGTNDFTVECWVNKTKAQNVLILDTRSGITATPWAFCIDGSNCPYFYDGTSYISTVPITLNQWTHIAVTRASGTLRIFVNGIQGYSATVTTNLDRTAGAIIGAKVVTPDNAFDGYLSSLRVVKGQALYTTTFTPSTAPLTTTSQGAIASNVSLLAFQSNRFIDLTNNFTLTASNSPSISQNSPFVEYDTTSGSGYFDGTGDYLTAAYNSAFDLGASDFTLEAWIYTSDSTSNFPSIVGRWQGSGTACWDLRPRSTDRGNFLVFVYSTDGTTAAFVDSNGPALSDNAWHHVVAVRSGNNFALFVDGTRRNTANLSGVTIFNSASAPLNVGYDPWGTTVFTGYLSNVRVVKGSAVYNPSLTTLTNIITGATGVPTAPLQAVSGTSLLTLQTRAPANNQGILDTSPNRFVVTRNGNVAQGSFSPFSQSGWSNYFDGNADYLSVPVNSTYALGSSNFTFEFWVNPNNASSAANIIAWGSDTQGWAALRLQLGSPYSILMSTNTSTWGINASTTGYAPVNGEWRHLAIVRNGTSVLVFENGTLIYSGSISGSLLQGSYNHIGKLQVGVSTDFALNGYISNLRIIKNQALYSGTTIGVNYFTPSTAPLTATAVGHTGSGTATSITGTVLLLTCQSNRFVDSSPTATSITVNGNVSVQPFSPFAPTQAYVASQLGGSAYFDGTNDYLSIPNVAFNNITTGTIECWVYLTDISGACITAKQQDGVTTQGLFTIGKYANTAGTLTTGTPGILYWHSTNTSPAIANSTAGIVANTWNHIAIVFNSSSVTFYINGVASGTTNGNYSLPSNTTPVPTIGQWIASGTQQIGTTGWISSLRITADSVYSGNFTPPTAPPTAIPGTSLLLNFTGADIVDSTGRNNLETVGNSAVQTIQSRWPPGSMYFDGTGDYLVVPSSTLHLFGTQPFTIEAWVYTTATKQYQHIYGTHNADTNWLLRLLDNKMMMYTGSGDITGVTVLAINTWYHVAAVREGTGTNQTKFYVNGTLDVTGTNATNYTTQSQAWIGAQINNPGLTYFQGYIADLRVTRSYARYVTGTGANANQMVFNGTSTLAFPTINTRPFSLA